MWCHQVLDKLKKTKWRPWCDNFEGFSHDVEYLSKQNIGIKKYNLMKTKIGFPDVGALEDSPMIWTNSI